MKGCDSKGRISRKPRRNNVRRRRLSGISLCSKRLVSSQIIAGRTLNAVSDGTFAATRMNTQGTETANLVLQRTVSQQGFQCASIRAAGAILPKNPARRLVYVQENRLAEYS